MNRVQGIYLALICFNALVNLPSLLHLLTKRNTPMPVLPEFEAPLAELATSIAAVKTIVANATGGPSTQDVSDTLAAVQAQADDLKTAASQ